MLVDVAREAGVSLKTSSQVLNNSKNVSEEKNDESPGCYGAARLSPERTGSRAEGTAIGMIVPNFSDPFTANAVHAVQEVARANGNVVILASSGGYPDVERSEIMSLVGRQIDGQIVALAESRTDSFSDIIPTGVHVVTFDQLLRDVDFDSVTVPSHDGCDAAAIVIECQPERQLTSGAHCRTVCAERTGGIRKRVELPLVLSLQQAEMKKGPKRFSNEVG